MFFMSFHATEMNVFNLYIHIPACVHMYICIVAVVSSKKFS